MTRSENELEEIPEFFASFRNLKALVLGRKSTHY
jgi:hypothetical protein